MDNEVHENPTTGTSGTSSNYSAEFWFYDSRLARRWNLDPVVAYGISGYSTFVDNPIVFVDPNGDKPGDVVVAFGGGDVFGTGDKGLADDIVATVQENVLNSEGGVARAYSSPFWQAFPENYKSLDRLTEAAYQFIISNYNRDDEGNHVEGGRVLIYGYSLGGVLAERLPERLAFDGIEVDLLVTVDAAAGPRTGEVDRMIGENVKVNLKPNHG